MKSIIVQVLTITGMIASHNMMNVSGFNILRSHTQPSTSTIHHPLVDDMRISSLQYKHTNEEDEGNVATEELKKPVERRKPSFSRVLSSTPIANLVNVDNLEDFVKCMDDNKDKVVVVRFYASWCQVSFLSSLTLDVGGLHLISTNSQICSLAIIIINRHANEQSHRSFGLCVGTQASLSLTYLLHKRI